MLRKSAAMVGRRLRLLGSRLETAALQGSTSAQSVVAPDPSTLPEWERVAGWLPKASLRGWDTPAVTETQETRWKEFTELLLRPGPLGISNESPATAGRENPWPHNLIMTYGYVLGRVLQGSGQSLKMLDWGSGVGHYCPITAALFPGVNLNYTAFDLPGLCSLGSKLLPHVRFLSDADDALKEKYDFVLAGSSLWYSLDWKETLQSLAAAANPWIYITRMVFLRHEASCVVVQRPARYGYDTEYQCWFLNQSEFLHVADDCDLFLEREFYFGPAPDVHGLQETGAFRGFLFRRR